jgi:hypothetical protein
MRQRRSWRWARKRSDLVSGTEGLVPKRPKAAAQRNTRKGCGRHTYTASIEGSNKLKRGDEMESQALIGHLVRYDSANIFRMWLPESHAVIRTRNVVFRSNTRYDGSTVYADLRAARTMKPVLDIADYEGEIEELEIRGLLELSALLSWHGTEMPEEDGTYDQLIEGLLQRPANGAQSLPTPEAP